MITSVFEVYQLVIPEPVTFAIEAVVAGALPLAAKNTLFDSSCRTHSNFGASYSFK